MEDPVIHSKNTELQLLVPLMPPPDLAVLISLTSVHDLNHSKISVFITRGLTLPAMARAAVEAPPIPFCSSLAGI